MLPSGRVAGHFTSSLPKTICVLLARVSCDPRKTAQFEMGRMLRLELARCGDEVSGLSRLVCLILFVFAVVCASLWEREIPPS